MNNSNDHTELIDRYLNGELSEPEKQKFEQRLLKNSELNNQYKLILQMYEIYSDVDAIEFREKLINIKSKRITDKNSLTNRMKMLYQNQYVLKVAIITILISVGIIMYFLFNNTKLDTDKIFAIYYTTLSTDGIVRAKQKTDISLNVEILDAINLKKYNNVIELYNNNKANLSREPEMLLYIGIAFIETGEYESAIDIFDKLDNNITNSNIILGYAIWYKGLCYLKTDKISEAIEEFQLLKQNYNFKKEKAEKIIKDIKK